MPVGPLWISEADVEALLDPVALIAAVAHGFGSVESGGMREPGSTRMDGLDGADAYATLYPACAIDGMTSAKILSGRPANAAEGRPEIDAVTALIDPATGRIAALVAARALTAYRTAAATVAVLAKLLRQTPARIGLVGTGTQAKAHGRLLAASGVAASLVIASPRGGRTKAKEAADGIAAANGIGAAASDVSSIASQCQALVLMTLAARPLELGPLDDDLVIASVGPCYPQAQELEPAILSRAAVVVSDQPDRLRRQWAGSRLLDVAALPLISAADLLAGKTQSPPPRSSGRPGLRVFLSDGRAFQDNVAAAMIYRAALAAGRGMRLP